MLKGTSNLSNWGLRQLHWVMLAGIVVLCLINVLNEAAGEPYWTVTKLIFLGFPTNLPTWYSSLLLLSGAAMAFLCYQRSVRQGVVPAYGWLALALLLTILSCDETAEMHEQIGRPLSRILKPHLRSDWQHLDYMFVVGGIALTLAVLIGIALWKHLRWSIPAALIILIGVVVLLGSGVGIEQWTRRMTYEDNRLLWHIEVICEETGEMLGSWLISFGLMLHADRIASRHKALEEGQKC